MKRRSYHLPDSKALLAQLASDVVTRFGVRMLYNTQTREWRLKDVGGTETFKTKRQCLMAYFRNYGRQYGSQKSPYTLRHPQSSNQGFNRAGWWRLYNSSDTEVGRWLVRPSRKELADTLRRLRNSDSRPSYKRPDTLGWRTFGWHPTKHCLVSPSQGTLWDTPELRIENWNEGSVVRGAAGIHACRLPRGDWRTAQRPSDMPWHPILALVERFGKFVLGSEGWRAEWVIIKELLAPDESTARALRRVYPELPISVARPNHWLRG